MPRSCGSWPCQLWARSRFFSEVPISKVLINISTLARCRHSSLLLEWVIESSGRDATWRELPTYRYRQSHYHGGIWSDPGINYAPYSILGGWADPLYHSLYFLDSELWKNTVTGIGRSGVSRSPVRTGICLPRSRSLVPCLQSFFIKLPEITLCAETWNHLEMHDVLLSVLCVGALWCF